MALLTGLHVARDSAGNGTAPRGGRLAQGGMLARDTGGVRTGVLFDDGSPVVSGTGTWFLSIRRFAAVGQSTPANGPVVFANDSTVGDVEIDAAPGSGSRIDIVYALQPLISADGGSGDSVQPIIAVASSGASGSPTPPLDQVPAGAVILGSGTVSAGMTSSADVVWTQPQWTVANGGALPVETAGRTFSLWNGAANMLFDLLRIDVQGVPAANLAKLRIVVVPPTTYSTNSGGDTSASLGELAFTGDLIAAWIIDSNSTSSSFGMFTLRWTSAQSSPSQVTFRMMGAGGAVGGATNVRATVVAIGYDA